MREEATTAARCAADDVNPSWWLEPDHDLLPPTTEPAERAVRRNRIDTALRVSRVNQLRAKIYCYECPLLTACREQGWDEGYHVWGGLDARERFQVRAQGTTDVLGQVPSKGHFSLHKPEVQRFMSGEDVSDIAADLGLSVQTILTQVRGALAVLRSEREEDAWLSKRELPRLPPGVNREAYRRGQVSSSSWRVEVSA